MSSFTAIEPSKSVGGLMINSFCQSIMCDEYFDNYNLNERIIQTRKIMQDGLKMPIEKRNEYKVGKQIIDDHNRISKEIKFKSNYSDKTNQTQA